MIYFYFFHFNWKKSEHNSFYWLKSDDQLLTQFLQVVLFTHNSSIYQFIIIYKRISNDFCNPSFSFIFNGFARNIAILQLKNTLYKIISFFSLIFLKSLYRFNHCGYCNLKVLCFSLNLCKVLDKILSFYSKPYTFLIMVWS